VARTPHSTPRATATLRTTIPRWSPHTSRSAQRNRRHSAAVSHGAQLAVGHSAATGGAANCCPRWAAADVSQRLPRGGLQQQAQLSTRAGTRRSACLGTQNSFNRSTRTARCQPYRRRSMPQSFVQQPLPRLRWGTRVRVRVVAVYAPHAGGSVARVRLPIVKGCGAHSRQLSPRCRRYLARSRRRLSHRTAWALLLLRRQLVAARQQRTLRLI
jgi:hypothetical protein